MRVDKTKIELPLPETAVRKRRPPDLAELTRLLDEARDEARAAQDRARLLRRQIQDAERRLRRSRSAMSSSSLGRTVSVGILAGVAAGISFALFVTLMEAIYGDSFLDWLRYSASIALGKSDCPTVRRSSFFSSG